MEQKLDINIPEEIAQGTYSNLAVIAHSQSEFILDFVSMMPGLPKGTVRSRIIMTPENTKRLLAALSENVANYEKQNGLIVANQNPPIPMTGGGMA